MNFNDKLSLVLSLQSPILLKEDDTKSPLDPRLGISAQYTKFLKNLRFIEEVRNGVRAAGLDDKLRDVVGPDSAKRLNNIDPRNPLSFEEAAIIAHSINASGIVDEIRDKLDTMNKKEVEIPDIAASGECPYCRESINISARKAGKTIKCPSCEKEFKVSSIGDASKRDAKIAYSAQRLMDEMESSPSNVTLHQLLSPRLIAIPPKQKINWRVDGKSHNYEFSFEKPLIDQVDVLIDIIKQLDYTDLWKKFNETYKARRTLLKYFRPDMNDDQILRTAMLYTVRNIADEVDERQASPKAGHDLGGLAFAFGASDD